MNVQPVQPLNSVKLPCMQRSTLECNSRTPPRLQVDAGERGRRVSHVIAMRLSQASDEVVLHLPLLLLPAIEAEHDQSLCSG